MTTTVSVETILAMSRLDAWKKLSDLNLARHYVPGGTGIEITTPQHQGMGASRKVFCEGRPSLDETVVEWAEGYGFTVRLHQGDKPAFPFKNGHFIYRLEDAEQGQSRMTTAMVYDLPLGILGRLVDGLLLRRVTRRTVEAIARNLKQVYESGVR